MKSFKTILLTGVMLVMVLEANAQLFIKNSTNDPVSVAIGWYNESTDYSGYVTKGWYNIEPGETVNPGLTFTANDDYYYFYVKGFEGDKKLLVSDQSFMIRNADKQYVKDNDSSYKWAMFKRKDVHFEFLEPKTRTLELTSDVVRTASPGFTLYNTYSYVSKEFSATAKLYSNGNNDYKIEYSGANAAGCIIDFIADGFYSEDSKELIFANEGCVVKFVFTNEKDIKLTAADGDECWAYSGMGCSFYLATYKRK